MTYQHLRLPCPVCPLLALGGELKNAVGLARDYDIWLSDPVGDLQSLENLTAFEAVVAALESDLQITPEAIICDLHPGYLSSRWGAIAAQARGLPLIKVQHHHAHITAVMADNGVTDDQSVIGLSLDGTGYGTDGAIWGGEVLVADYASFTRAAQITYAPLPGGDAAIHKPYRMALAQLWAAGIDWDDDLPPVQTCSEVEQRVLRRQLERSLNTVPTSSLGRLVDAAAALIGLREIVTFEAEAAIELEKIAAEVDQSPYTFRIDTSGAVIQIDPAPVLCGLIADWRAGVSPPIMSGRFHRATADALIAVTLLLRERTGITTAALSGGVWQNRLLRRLVEPGLAAQEVTVLTHQQVPPSDAGLALGQIMIAQRI